ncbi:hypothetical protein [Kitasatospora griseola]|uniref:hypothetical protein n=1 Tax=Kitasatospora griseola TaxID=2064 RepID=UPI00166FE319|nr:hypothetical protein [Kitasatospora griseola]GGR00765.1 hypothetical protein GCM10010195_65720 [Kitasatospora griseola]
MRLNLPFQADPVDRTTPYQPFLVPRIGTNTATGEQLRFMEEAGGYYGADVGDPPSDCRDARGWSCQPLAGYVRRGIA